MKTLFKISAIVVLGSIVLFSSCNNTRSNNNKEMKTDPIQTVDEAKLTLLPNDIFEDTINGVHVFMEYKADNKYFKGSLKNVTKDMIPGIKVNVYLSNGLILNRILPTDLKVDAYETSVIIDAEVKEWDKWGIELEFTSK